MGVISQLARATALWAKENLLDLISIAVIPQTNSFVQKRLGSPPSRWATANLWAEKTIDGALIGGIAPPNVGAKFAIPKGLPKQGERSLAIENEPHSLEGFSGVIAKGYGRGTKTLLAVEKVAVKIGGKSILTDMEYHLHDAERAGVHYDLALANVPSGLKQFEVHIPRGEIKGRYTFLSTRKGMIVVPMNDEGTVVAKPKMTLKPTEILAKIKSEPGQWIVEQKLDGSLGNVVIKGNRAVFRSHRDSGETYYDRLPQLEDLGNHSRLYLCRGLFPGPQLSGTVLQGELLHEDGASRVSGILNALPARAQATQQLRGPVSFHGWDIVKYRGKDVSGLRYRERRQVLENVIDEIRLFNPQWNVVKRAPAGQDPLEFYRAIVSDPRGLPWSEGVVVKSALTSDVWIKVKHRDTYDVEVVEFVEGSGKYRGTLGALVVENPDTGARGEIGSFQVSDTARDWIWNNREMLRGQTAEIDAMELTERGVPRAGVFVRWHPSKSEAGLLMYSEALAGGDQEETLRTKYALISAAGWKR